MLRFSFLLYLSVTIRFATPDYFVNDDTASGFTNGFGDVTVGLKEQLGPTRGGFGYSVRFQVIRSR
jgi:hypothetical protein